jgi:hypothetical protein
VPSHEGCRLEPGSLIPEAHSKPRLARTAKQLSRSIIIGFWPSPADLGYFAGLMPNAGGSGCEAGVPTHRSRRKFLPHTEVGYGPPPAMLRAGQRIPECPQSLTLVSTALLSAEHLNRSSHTGDDRRLRDKGNGRLFKTALLLSITPAALSRVEQHSIEELWIFISPLYSINPSCRNLFMKWLTRERAAGFPRRLYLSRFGMSRPNRAAQGEGRE